MDWQTMDTAPRDGTRFWGRCGDDAVAMFWHPKFEAFVSSFRRIKMAPGLLIDGESFKDHSPVVHEPTAWQALPTPSAKETGSDG